jgi:hypothetical protein
MSSPARPLLLRAAGVAAVVGLFLVAFAVLFHMLSGLNLLFGINRALVGDGEIPVDAYSTYTTWVKIVLGCFALNALALGLWRHAARQHPAAAHPSPYKEAKPLAWAGGVLLLLGGAAAAVGVLLVGDGYDLAFQDRRGALSDGLEQMETGAAVGLGGSVFILLGIALLIIAVWHSSRQLVRQSASASGSLRRGGAADAGDSLVDVPSKL